MFQTNDNIKSNIWNNQTGMGVNRGSGFPPASKTGGIPSDASVSAKTAYGMNASGMKVIVNDGPISTGKGGIPASLKVKNAGSMDAPGVEHTVNLF